MKIRPFHVLVLLLSAITFAGCAGGNKLTKKQLSFAELINIYDSGPTTVKNFMAQKGWDNTTAADLANDDIEDYEISWSLNSGRSGKVAGLVMFPGDYLYGNEVTYYMKSKDLYNQLAAQVKSHKDPKLKQCGDKAHLKDNTLHFYDDYTEVHFEPASGKGMYSVSVFDAY